MNIQKTLSSGWTASFSIEHVSGDVMPKPGDEVTMYWDAVKRFGGLIQSVKENCIPSKIGTGPTILNIQCTGYGGYLDRVIVARLYTLVNVVSGVLSVIVQDLVDRYFSQFGIYYVYSGNPSVLIPDTLMHYITGTEALNRLRDQLSGWDWWVDANKGLHFADMSQTATFKVVAPFTLTNANSITNAESIAVTTTASKFRNSQWVLPSQDVLALRTDSTVATNTGQVFFETVYPITLQPIVVYNGVQQTVGTTNASPWVWVNEISGVFRGTSAPQTGVGDTVDITYRNPFPVALQAKDDASIAAKGLYAAVYQAKDVTTADTATAMAQGMLDAYGTNGDFPLELVFTYNSKSQSAWLEPGMVMQGVAITFPTATGDFTVEQVSSQETDGLLWRHTVTARNNLGDVTTGIDEQQFLTSARVGISSPPTRAEWMLAEDLPGLTNPGLFTGLVKNFIPVQAPGTIDSWTITPTSGDEPTGADLQIDILLNGVSIFPVGATNTAVLPAGQTTPTGGITFVTDNILVYPGDILQPNVLQVGSTNAGTNIKLILNIRTGQAV